MMQLIIIQVQHAAHRYTKGVFYVCVHVCVYGPTKHRDLRSPSVLLCADTPGFDFLMLRMRT